MNLIPSTLPTLYPAHLFSLHTLSKRLEGFVHCLHLHWELSISRNPTACPLGRQTPLYYLIFFLLFLFFVWVCFRLWALGVNAGILPLAFSIFFLLFQPCVASFST